MIFLKKPKPFICCCNKKLLVFSWCSGLNPLLEVCKKKFVALNHSYIGQIEIFSIVFGFIVKINSYIIMAEENIPQPSSPLFRDHSICM